MCPLAALLSNARDFSISCSSEACIFKGRKTKDNKRRTVSAIIDFLKLNMNLLCQNIGDDVAMHIG